MSLKVLGSLLFRLERYLLTFQTPANLRRTKQITPLPLQGLLLLNLQNLQLHFITGRETKADSRCEYE